MLAKQASKARVSSTPKTTPKSIARGRALLKRVSELVSAENARKGRLRKKFDQGILFVWHRGSWLRKVDEATPLLESMHAREGRRRNRSRIRKESSTLRRVLIGKRQHTQHVRFELVRTSDGRHLGHVHLPIDDEAFRMAHWVAYGDDWKPVLGEGHMPTVAEAKRALLGVIVAADLLPLSVLTHGP